MQKRSSLLLAFSFAFLLFSACGDQTKESNSGDNTATSETTGDDANSSESEKETPEPKQEVASLEKDIDPSELSELMEEESNLQLLDVRTPEETSQGIIEGAKVININDADFIARAGADLKKDQPLAVYCGSGMRSKKAIALLRDNGFTMLYNLAGGVNAWTADGNELSE